MGKIDIDQDAIKEEALSRIDKAKALVMVHKYCIIGGIVLFILGLMI
jgi:hypothetical protein